MIKQKSAFLIITLLVTFLSLLTLSLHAQIVIPEGVPVGPTRCYVWENGVRKQVPCNTPGTKTSNPSDGYRISRAQKRENKATAIANEAYDANERGFAFGRKGDWTNAIIAYQEAVNKNPNEKIYRDNLAKAKDWLEIQKREQQEQQQIQQNKIAISNMQQTIIAFTQTLNNSPSTGGLDFEGKNTNSNSDKTTTNSELQFGDPNIVDTRNIPSALPKGIENAIAGVYKNTPPGVSERVGKGFQAVMTKDWKVARVWFQEALKLDPDNEGLKKFIVLCDYSPDTKLVNNTTPEKIPVPEIFFYTPTSDEIKAYRENIKAIKETEKSGGQFLPNEANAFSDNFRKYVYSLNADDTKLFNALCEYTADFKQDKNLLLQKIPVPTSATYVPTSQEIEAYQENNRRSSDPVLWLAPITSPTGGFSEKFKKYVMSLNETEMTKFLSIQLPKEEDIKFLFPMELPLTTAEKLKAKIFGLY